MGLERINILRKSKGITIEELSKLSGVPVSTIKKITAGITTNPSLDTIKAIVNAMGYTLDDLDDERPELLSDAELCLIKNYRQLTPEGKLAVTKVIEALLQPKATAEQYCIAARGGKESIEVHDPDVQKIIDRLFDEAGRNNKKVGDE